MAGRAKHTLALAALLIAASPAAAEPAAIYRELAEAKTTDAVWERSFAAMIDRAKIAFQGDPMFAKAEARCPGYIDAVFTATSPLMRERHFAERDQLRAGMAQILSEGLNEAQAREAIAFYRSPEGGFLMELGADSNNYDEKFAVKPEQFDRKAFEGDLARTHDTIHSNADPAMIERVERELDKSRWYHPYLKVHGRIQDLRFRISKAKPSPEQAALLDQATKRGSIQHFANCGQKVPLRTP